MSNEVKILNITQVKCYLSDGVEPLRLELGTDGKLLFIYDKEQSQKVFKKWKNQEYDLSQFHNEVR